MLRVFGDDVVLHELDRRLGAVPDASGTELIDKLVQRLQVRAAAELVERLTPVRELDYDRARIQLHVSSSKIGIRARPVEKEPFTVEWIERSIGAGDVFYDIGANVGAYTLIAAKATGNRARVYSFEPSPSSYRDLARNVLLNGCAESVVLLPVALWSASGPLRFHLSSVDPGAAGHLAGDVAPDGHLTETVLAVRLDDLVERFDLPVPTHAKIDVDGYELEVLRGAARTLARPEWRSIIVELDREATERNDAVRTLLSDAGFEAGRHHARPDRPEAYFTFTRRGSDGQTR